MHNVPYFRYDYSQYNARGREGRYRKGKGRIVDCDVAAGHKIYKIDRTFVNGSCQVHNTHNRQVRPSEWKFVAKWNFAISAH